MYEPIGQVIQERDASPREYINSSAWQRSQSPILEENKAGVDRTGEDESILIFVRSLSIV